MFGTPYIINYNTFKLRGAEYPPRALGERLQNFQLNRRFSVRDAASLRS
jgi:hypothetical protein